MRYRVLGNPIVESNEFCIICEVTAEDIVQTFSANPRLLLRVFSLMREQIAQNYTINAIVERIAIQRNIALTRLGLPISASVQEIEEAIRKKRACLNCSVGPASYCEQCYELMQHDLIHGEDA